MNIKLHTPKSLKNGSGMSSLKQFLLSLLATTVSIALTFGTAAVIDYKKKQSEKREIVMMVMYDMYNSLKSVEKSDSMLRQSMKIQLELTEDTSKYRQSIPQIARLIPKVDYTETTEHIFSSSIETINTVGNVIFSESVAEFYQSRRVYKEMVCDSIWHDVVLKTPVASMQYMLDFDYGDYALMTRGILSDMRKLFVECKQMTKVTDEELDVYCRERELMKNNAEEEIGDEDSLDELMELIDKVNDVKKKLR